MEDFKPDKIINQLRYFWLLGNILEINDTPTLSLDEDVLIPKYNMDLNSIYVHPELTDKPEYYEQLARMMYLSYLREKQPDLLSAKIIGSYEISADDYLISLRDVQKEAIAFGKYIVKAIFSKETDYSKDEYEIAILQKSFEEKYDRDSILDMVALTEFDPRCASNLYEERKYS